jgi:GT2 family glycosyltransferase
VSVVLLAGAAGPPAGDYDVDIVILALDRADETLAAVASALDQTGVSKHLFILDQGSGADTLRQLTDAVSGRCDTTLLTATTNLGVAGGRNVASNLGHGRVIVALDNDAEFATADTVSRMVAALDAEPGLGAIGCRIVTFPDGRDDPSSWGYPASLLSRAGECFDAVTYVGAGHAIRRAAWEQAGGYDAALFFCWEEFDFCLRAIALGWRVRYRGDIVIRHKVCGERRVEWCADVPRASGGQTHGVACRRWDAATGRGVLSCLQRCRAPRIARRQDQAGSAGPNQQGAGGRLAAGLTATAPDTPRDSRAGITAWKRSVPVAYRSPSRRRAPCTAPRDWTKR